LEYQLKDNFSKQMRYFLIIAISIITIFGFNFFKVAQTSAVADVTLTSSAFSDSDAEDTHRASQWQVTTASGVYTSPTVDSGTDTTNKTTYLVSASNLTASTTYYWRVRYQDNHLAWSSWSSEGTFITDADAVPDTTPSCPTSITATAGDAQVVLSWGQPVSNDTGLFWIYRSTVSGETGSQIGTATISSYPASYTDTSLTNGTTYYYTVNAKNSGTGEESSGYNQVSATPVATAIVAVAVPNCPANLSSQAGDKAIDLSWDAPVSGSLYTGYKIYRSVVSGTQGSEVANITDISIKIYHDSGLTNETTYYYTVVAYNSSGEAVLCSQISNTPTGRPNCPSGATLSISGTRATLNWTNATNSDFSHVVIYRSQASGQTGDLVYTSGSSAINSFAEDINPATRYYYTIVSVDTDGNTSSGSNQISTSQIASCQTGFTAKKTTREKNYLTWTAGSQIYKNLLYKKVSEVFTQIAVLDSATNYFFDTDGGAADYELRAQYQNASSETTCGQATVSETIDPLCPTLPALTLAKPVLNIVGDTAQGVNGSYLDNIQFKSIDLAWSVPDFPLKTIYLSRDQGSVWVLDKNSTSYIDTNQGVSPTTYHLWAEYDLSQYNNPSNCPVPVSDVDFTFDLSNLGGFDILNPSDGSVYNRGDDLELVWTQPPVNSQDLAKGDHFDIDISDDGNYRKEYRNLPFFNPLENSFNRTPPADFGYKASTDLTNPLVKNIYTLANWESLLPFVVVDKQITIKVNLADSSGEILHTEQIVFTIRNPLIVARQANYPFSIASSIVTIPTMILMVLANALSASNSAGFMLIDKIINFSKLLPTKMNLFFTGSWLRRKRTSWGTILSEHSNKPVGKALVELHKEQFGKVVKTAITDPAGRFWFLISEPGQYFISTQKTGFRQFVSQSFNIFDINKLPINQKIYLKPVELETNVAMLKLLAFVFALAKVFDAIRIPVLVLGSIMSVYNLIVYPGLTTYIIFGLYIFLWVIEIILYLVPRPFGKVLDSISGAPLKMAIVRVFKFGQEKPIQTYVTDKIGRYHFLLSPGKYHFKVSKLGYNPWISTDYNLQNLHTKPNFKFYLQAVE